MKETIVTYWYERGSRVVMTLEPGDHGRFVGTLELTPEELREACVVAWKTRALAGLEATLPLDGPTASH